MDVYRAEEFMVVGAMFTALGQLQAQREAAKGQDIEGGPSLPNPETTGGNVGTAIPAAFPLPQETAPVKARRKAVAKIAETTAVEPTPEPAVVGSIAPAPAVEAPKPTAPPVAAAPTSTYTKADLEDKTRALAKTNFTAAKALLDKFGVKRFGELPTEKYEEYGKAISAL